MAGGSFASLADRLNEPERLRWLSSFQEGKFVTMLKGEVFTGLFLELAACFCGKSSDHTTVMANAISHFLPSHLSLPSHFTKAQVIHLSTNPSDHAYFEPVTISPMMLLANLDDGPCVPSTSEVTRLWAAFNYGTTDVTAQLNISDMTATLAKGEAIKESPGPTSFGLLFNAYLHVLGNCFVLDHEPNCVTFLLILKNLAAQHKLVNSGLKWTN